MLVFVGAGFTNWIPNDTGAEGLIAAPPPDGTIEAVSDELFGTWMLPFEATILLLTIAAVGTVALAQFKTGGSAAGARRPDLVAHSPADEQTEEPA